MQYVFLTIVFQKEEDGRWTAECKELGTATFGSSFEDTQQKIEEAICLHLYTLEEVGEVERFFKENNIRVIAKRPRTVKINVPTNPLTFIQPYIHPLQATGIC